ncbi:hypothetical protein FRC16_006086 [Serendipita sp. 398]|nr:hypothetical protein FRC16_006086 [Serendipita sp. 398]
MELTGLGYETRLQRSPDPSLNGLHELERCLTTGGEPNPTAPRTPEPEEEPQARKELAPPGILSPEAIVLLAPFSIFGLLARLGIEAITTYSNQSVFTLAWVQAVGCLVMGIAQSQKTYIMAFYPPLYLGITTGFCGSLTTFAGWQRDVFIAWTNKPFNEASGWQSFIDGATRLLFTQAISMGSFLLGLSIGHHEFQVTPSIPPRKLRLLIAVVSLLAYIACFPLFFLLSPSYRSMATAALLFSWPGSLTRHLFGSFLNARVPHFPLGTFLSNMLGTCVTSVAYVLQNLDAIHCNITAMALLQGLSDGYAGCLSTVSTYAVEVNLMSRRHGWRYVLASWITAQLILVLIVGSPKWSGHLTPNITSCS